MIRTKIVATMGPACANVDTLYRLFEAGADVCRLNFSHGTLDQHLQHLRNIREAAARFSHPIAVLGDLGGPKIRLGHVTDEDGAGGMPVQPGDEIVIQRAPIVGAKRRVSSTFKNLVDDVQVGHRVFIEDGMLKFLCTDKNYNELRCNCTVGGVLKTSKGINLPDSFVNVAAITDRDWECADWAIENDLDYLALSFVRKPDDITLLRQHLTNRSSDIQLIAKIEKAEALQHIDGIIEASDGLMVARGDLGVELDLARVPIIQKDLIKRCQTAGKPVIVATQMLQSMIEQASPTRAEVSDVANAIFDGTDALMLSGETSVGKFPIGAVLVMSRVAEVTEEYQISNPSVLDLRMQLKTMALSAAVAKGVRQMVSELKAKLVVVWSQTGATARIFSKTRFPVPIIALSSDHRALRRMVLHFGVIPQEIQPPDDPREFVRSVDDLVRQQNFARGGDRILIVAGSSLGTPGMLNGVMIHTVGNDREERLSAGAEAMVDTGGIDVMTTPSPVRMLLVAAAMFAIAGCASEQSRTSPSTPPATQIAVASTTEAATEPATEAATEPTSGPASEPTTQASTEPTTRRSGGPSIASARAAYWLRQPAIFTIQANDFESLWESCEASARHFGFIIDRTDYRGGVITTQPLTSKQFWEFWRNDVVTLEDLANSSLATYRRTLRFDIEKSEGGGYAASPRVVIERFARTESPITASVFLRNAFRSTRGSRIYGTRETDRGVYLPRQYWYATGRDEALEKNVASELRKQLARTQRKRTS